MAENTNQLTELTPANWAELENLASKLEEAWKKGAAVDLAAFLPEAGSALRKHALVELVKVDLECRWRKGQSVSLDYYLDKFPDLGRPRDLPAKLVFEEYRVRQLFGDKPPLALYQKRFPAQFPQLERFLTEEPLPTVVHAATVRKPTDETRAIAKTEKVEPTAPSAHGRYKDNTQQMGEYRMLERLGSGAFGEVWKVELPGGILKAVKVIFRPIDHEEAKRELESLELIKGLRHHFLLQTISFKSTDDKLRILMDLADCSLRDLLKKSKKEGQVGLPLVDNVKWLRQAAEALDYLHGKKMQHRDIKPENILLSEGNVRVADFGLARVQQTQRLASMSGAGTPLYMPPESWNDKQHANSDQYSLAATYAECRLGRRIYDSDGLASLMQAHVHDKPKLDPLPAEEQAVLLKALAKNPDHRYASCTAFADDLTRAVAKRLPPGSIPGLPVVEVEHSFAKRRARQKQKQMQSAFIVVGILGFFILGAIIASLLMPNPEPKPNPEPTIALPAAGAAGPFRPVHGTEVVEIGGKKYYKQIECVLNGTPETAVRFNLIPWTDRGKSSFYLMEDKVSNGVFRAFGQANPSAVNGSRWELGGRVARRPTAEEKKTGLQVATAPLYPIAALLTGPPWNWNAIRVLYGDEGERSNEFYIQEEWPLPEDIGATDPSLPVLRVDIQEAHWCAEWLGGVLPSAEQWDKAAGAYESDRGKGPFREPFEPGEVAVGRSFEGPMPVGSARKDVAIFSGCRDMSGNGFEWNRTIIFDGEAKEYFGNPTKVGLLAKVPLRGQSYIDPEPLTYEVLRSRVLDLAFSRSQRLPGTDWQVGFRIALLP